MRVDSIKTENFRLLQRQEVEFGEGINVICGSNAQGKTTLLEAVYLLTGMKSFRSRFDKDLIAFGEDCAFLEGQVDACGREQRIDMRFQRGKSRQIRVNGALRRSSELTENLTAVLFSPDDLRLIRGGAAERRRMMDTAISQLRPGYRTLLSDYNRIYENKTRILRDWREKPSLLEPLDEFNASLALYSARLIRYRASFVRRLQETASPVHREFSGGSEELQICYATVSTVTDTAASERQIYEEIMERQLQLRQAELEAELCLVGAHKDDMPIFINGIDARSFASQGQTRTAALSLKLGERDIFRQETGESPVLLLDDVLSELDKSRQEFVLNRIQGGQTLITCCDEQSVSRLIGGDVLRLEKGRVS